MLLKIHFASMSAEHFAKIQAAQNLLYAQVNHPEFGNHVLRELIINHGGSFKQLSKNQAENSPLGIINHVLSSTPQIEVYVFKMPWWKRYSSAIAQESNGKIGLRDTYLNRASLKEIAATLLHESCHSLGYTHSFWPNRDRNASVPYLFGNALLSFNAPGNE